MKKETFLHISIGFLLGVLVTILITQIALSSNNNQALKVLGISDQADLDELEDEDFTSDESSLQEELNEF